MFNQIRNAAIPAALVISALFAPALGRTADQPSGVVVAVDREARTLTLLDRETEQRIEVRIPESARVAIREIASRGSSVEFEQVQVGMQYRGIR